MTPCLTKTPGPRCQLEVGRAPAEVFHPEAPDPRVEGPQQGGVGYPLVSKVCPSHAVRGFG